MKAKIILGVLMALCLFSCDDNTGTLGIEMFPGNDQGVSGKLKRYKIETASKAMEKIHARTGIGYIGRFTDPDFGPYEAGFLTQFNCPEDFEFPKVYDKNNPEHKTDKDAVMVKDEIFRTELILRYQKYFGDSITPSHISVYLLDKKLDPKVAKYTDIDPTQYYDENNPKSRISERAYTAVDYAVKDSIRNTKEYVPSLAFNLPNELGQGLLKKSRELGKEQFYKEFKNLIKGMYFKCDGAESNILYIDQVELRLIFESYFRDDKGEIIKKKVKEENETEFADSTGYRYRLFASTREIIQANSLNINPEVIQEKIDEPNVTYLKTPAGIYTQATLPLQLMSEDLPNDTLNVAKVKFVSFNNNTNQASVFPMDVPSHLLLVREKDREIFFEENRLPDNITSYMSERVKNRYEFPDLSQLIATCINEKKEAEKELKEKGSIVVETAQGNKTASTIEEWEKLSEWNKVALIPVSVTIDTSKQEPIITTVNMELKPTCAKLQGGHKADHTPITIDMEVVYTSFK